MIATNDWEWEWNGGDEDTVIVHEQRAVAVYINTRGEVVIRQKGDATEEGDTIVLLTPDNAVRVGLRLQSLGESDLTGFSPEEAIPREADLQQSNAHPLKIMENAA